MKLYGARSLSVSKGKHSNFSEIKQNLTQGRETDKLTRTPSTSNGRGHYPAHTRFKNGSKTLDGHSNKDCYNCGARGHRQTMTNGSVTNKCNL